MLPFPRSVLSFTGRVVLLGRVWVRDDNHASVLSGFQANLYPLLLEK